MHRHGANSEPHDTPLLAYGVSSECLSWTNKRQNQLPVSLSKVLERQSNMFSTFWTQAYVFNLGVIILLFCGISQTNLHSYGKGRHSISFYLFFYFNERHLFIIFVRISQLANDKQTHKGRLFGSSCENVPHTSRRSTDCIFFWNFKDHYTIKDDRFVSLGPFQMLQTERTLVFSSNRNVCSFKPHLMGQKNVNTFLYK